MLTERDTKYKTWLRPKLEKIRKESALFAVNFRASWADRRMEFVGKFPSLGGESLETGRFVSFLLLLLGPGLISWLAFESDYSSEINRGEYEGLSSATRHVFLVSALIVFALLSLRQYYRTHIVEVPSLTYTPSALNERIVELFAPSVRDFAPSPWAISAHVQSFLFAYWPMKVVFGWDVPKVVEREELDMSDGGVIALDWFAAPSDETTPVVLMLPGVVGKTDNCYILRFALAVRKEGWRAVCKSYRGINVRMKQARPEMWGPRTVADLAECVDHICARYPNAPLLVVGFSVGGMQVLSYLGESKDERIAGAVSISGVFSAEHIYPHGLKQLPAYDLALFSSLAVDTQHAWSTLSAELGHELAEVFKTAPWKFYSWHSFVTQHLALDGNKYASVEEYFRESGDYHLAMLGKVDLPVLCTIASDDPLVPPAVGAEARQVAASAPGAFLLETQRGGHCGWFEGAAANSWMDDMSVAFLKASMDAKGIQY